MLPAMATTGDPWRTLGLTPGATLDEVRRAYRRLAKANHPDAAGEGALPRFLAIQAAYEAIAGPTRGRRVGARPGAARPAPAQPPEAEPWRADPERARASGRADGRRPRPGTRPGPRQGTRPGPGPDGTDPASGATGDGDPAGATRDAGASDRGRSSSSSSGRSRRPSSRRQPKTAGPYSTSYDAADEEPFEPGWGGATWYGASSGTYWTINPKEYADPRKHGPEYQARARRARGATGWILDESVEPGGDPAEADATPMGPADGRASASTDYPSPPPPRSERPGSRWRTAGWTAASATPPGGSGGRRPGDAPPAPPPTAAGVGTADAGPFRVPALPNPRTGAGRAAIALLGWPPLALFAASAIGESTGCGRYAASCAELSAPGTWVLVLAILILLLAAPAVARWSAHGTVSILLIGVPCAVILSAAGGTNVREASAPILLGVLAIAYLVGIAYALLGSVLGRRRESPGPGSTMAG